MTLIQDLHENGIDCSKLPFDCVAKASVRLGNFFYEEPCGKFTKDYTQADYSRDLNIILGDPIKGVSAFISVEDAEKCLERR